MIIQKFLDPFDKNPTNQLFGLLVDEVHECISNTFTKNISPTGVCLVVAGGLAQDLTLILSTKKHQNKQNKQRKQNPSTNSSTTKEVERDSL